MAIRQAWAALDMGPSRVAAPPMAQEKSRIFRPTSVHTGRPTRRTRVTAPREGSHPGGAASRGWPCMLGTREANSRDTMTPQATTWLAVVAAAAPARPKWKTQQRSKSPRALTAAAMATVITGISGCFVARNAAWATEVTSATGMPSARR